MHVQQQRSDIDLQEKFKFFTRLFPYSKKDLQRTYACTGGPSLTRKSLPRFLAYVHIKVEAFHVSRGLTTVQLTQISCNTFFSSPKMRVRRGPSVRVHCRQSGIVENTLDHTACPREVVARDGHCSWLTG